MNLIKDINQLCLAILFLITSSVCFDKYIHFTKSKAGMTNFYGNQLQSTKEIRQDNLNGFNSPPKMLLGIYSIQWINFSDNEHEFNISVEEIDQQQYKVLLSTTPQSKQHIYSIKLKYLIFESNEAQIQNIKIDEQDIISMKSNVNQPKIRQLKKQYNYKLSKKPFSKRNVSCFILGYRQEYSTSPPNSDQIFSFFVESTREFNENQFELTFTTLDESNTTKWVTINCIEYYQYDQYFIPNYFIYAIEENKYSYSSIKSFNSYLQNPTFEIKSQTPDIQFDWQQIFFGFQGMDVLFSSNLELDCFYADAKEFLYNSYNKSTCRAVSSIFILFKMNNCPLNCEDCINQQTCQKCKVKFILNNDGICVECKSNCLSCDSNLNCKVCEEPYFNYKGLCYLNQPKRTFCVSKSVYPPFQQT